MIRIQKSGLTLYSWPVLVALTILVLAAVLVLPRLGRAGVVEYSSVAEMRTGGPGSELIAQQSHLETEPDMEVIAGADAPVTSLADAYSVFMDEIIACRTDRLRNIDGEAGVGQTSWSTGLR